jgi:hypothetical protein
MTVRLFKGSLFIMFSINGFKPVFFSLVLSLFFSFQVFGKPVSLKVANQFAKGWLKVSSAPLGANLKRKIADTKIFKDETGKILYYVINMIDGGYIVVSSDDYIEPIIAFSASGKFKPDNNNPLFVMLEKDMRARQNYIKKEQKKLKTENQLFAVNKSVNKVNKKWTTFTSYADKEGIVFMGSIDDPRVDPLIQSKWDQTNIGGLACFNYYAPTAWKNWQEGNSDNYPCGCVATAIAQLMRYYQYPTEGVGTAEFNVEVDGKDERKPLRGGDGNGGAYEWDKMTLVLSGNEPEENRQAIGALTHDIGLAVNMSYSASFSGAYFDEAITAFKFTFNYSNVIQGRDMKSNDDYNDLSGTLLNNMANSNLDAGMPVILAVFHTDYSGGHAIVCDGYGYNASTLYHHLNMGWGGESDDWYNLPDIGFDFNVIAECLYNIYVSGNGEIVSGRVTDDSGHPLAGITVEAISLDESFSAITDSRGIYAIAHITSDKSYTLKCVDNEIPLNLGTSVNDSSDCANRWAKNFIVSKAIGYSPDTFTEAEANDGSIGNSITIQLYQETFTPDVLDFITVTNIPEGLNVEFNILSNTELTMSLNGQALNHYHDSDDINDLTIAFADGAFSGNDASIIGDSTKENLKIDFTVNTYALNYISDLGGIINGDSEQIIEYGNDGMPVEALPDEGYHFTEWSDGLTEMRRQDLNITQDLAFTASFEINIYSLNYSAGDGGTLNGELEQQVTFGSDGTTIEAVPDIGYHFLNWSDGVEDNPRTDVNISDDIDVTAVFEINTYSLNYSAGENGTINGDTSQTVTFGDDATEVEALPNEGFHFTEWSDGIKDNPRLDISVADNIDVTASFEINVYNLNYSAGLNGSLIGDLNQTVEYGNNATEVEALPDTGYHFIQWSDGSQENPRSDSDVKENLDLEASFDIGTYTVSYGVQDDIGGELVGDLTQALVHGDDASAVEAIPQTGYHFVQWTDGSTDNPRQDLAVKSNIDVKVLFELDTFTLTYETDGHGTISGESVQTVSYGHDASEVTAVPDVDYVFLDWSDGITEITRQDLNIKSDNTVTANFKLRSFSVSGTVSGDIKLGVTITIDEEHSAITDAAGHFIITDLPNHKAYTLKASAPGFILSPSFQTITVNGADLTDINFLTVKNNPPIAENDSYSVVLNETLTVSANNGVLANDIDIENTVLAATLVENVQFGSVALNRDGSFVYTPNEDFVGEDSFSYLVSDGVSDSEIAIATISVTYLKITIGSIVSVKPEMVDGLDENSTFDKTPKIYGVINGKSLSLKKDKSSTPKLAKGIWKKKYPLLGKIKSGFAGAVNGKEQSKTVQLAVQAIVNGIKINNNAQKVLLVPPEINSVDLKGNIITIKGSYFGMKPPKVALEPKSGGKLLKCKVDKKAYSFNPITAASSLRASFKPVKVLPGSYWLVIDNKIGIGIKIENGENILPELIIE